MVPAAAAFLLVALSALSAPAGGTTAGPASASAPGAPTVRADFNDDGIEDLSVGSSLESVGGASRAGAVHVLLGGGAGLTGTGSQVFSQDSPGVADDPEQDDWFGTALTTGDFDGDGFSDLAVSAINEAVGSVASAGVVHVLYGSPTGIQTAGSQMFSQDSPGIPETVEAQDQFGVALAGADVDGDGIDDLAVGSHLDSVDGQARAGVANVLYGTDGTGIDGAGSTLLSQAGTQVPSDPEASDLFGTSLSAADFDGDGFADVAIGAPGESAGTVPQAGAVNVLDGAAGSGLSATGTLLIVQGSGGVGSAAEAGDRVGSALGSGDFDGDGRDDLAAGAPGEDVGQVGGAGAFNALDGSASGLTGAGSQVFTQDSPGVPDSVEPSDAFGAAFAATRSPAT